MQQEESETRREMGVEVTKDARKRSTARGTYPHGKLNIWARVPIVQLMLSFGFPHIVPGNDDGQESQGTVSSAAVAVRIHTIHTGTGTAGTDGAAIAGGS